MEEKSKQKLKHKKSGDRGRVIGIVDIGSNTIRFNIYQVLNKKRSILFTKKVFAGLSAYVENQKLQKAGIKKIVKTLTNFHQVFKAFKLDEAYVFATAAVRQVNNSEEVVKTVYEQTGFKIRILTGQEESQMDYYGAALEVDLNNAYIVDIGGGSTEIITCQEGKYSQGFSIPYGALNVYRQSVNVLFPTKTEAKQIRQLIRKELQNHTIKMIEAPTVYGIGGTIRACGNMLSELYEENYKQFTRTQIRELIEGFINQEAKIIKTTLQIAPDRMHTQTTGMIILDEVLTFLEQTKMSILKKGIRDGYLDVMLQQEILKG